MATQPQKGNSGVDLEPEPVKSGSDARLQAEKVGAGSFGAFANVLRGLPQAIDDISRDFGNDIFERMYNDAYLAGNIGTLKNAILEDGAELISAIPAPTKGSKPDPAYEAAYKRSVEILDFCKPMIDGLARPLEDVIEEMLDAMWSGSRVSELVWAMEGDLKLKAIKPKARRTTSYVVDAFNNIHGILALTPGNALYLNNAFMSPDFLTGAEVIPREKFCILTYRMRNSDPRGSSIFRPAYTAWKAKQLQWPSYLQFLDEYGGGITWMTTAEGQGAGPVRDPATGLLSSDGNGIYTQTAQEQAANDLALLKAGRCGAFPFGTAVHIDRPTGKGEAFTPAMDLLNREMTMAMLGSVRATMESQHGSKADSSTSQDLVGALIRYLRRWVAAVIRQDALYKIVLYNFGKQDADLFTPRTTLTGIDKVDLAETLKSFAAAGFKFAKNQFAWCSEMVGAPEPDPDSGYLGDSSAASDPEADGQPDKKKPAPNDKPDIAPDDEDDTDDE